jgi:ubiquinone/menaquinone biosynthesis C-methylase UbiE
VLYDTRERALPGHAAQSLDDYLVFLKHTALYRFAAERCRQMRVLDCGCGEGYGSAALARSAAFVVASDRSEEAVRHAAATYPAANIGFVVCDAQRLPFRSGAFQAVTSFEVIEHLPIVSEYLGEVKRVGTGQALISTPNRRLRLLPFQKPWNRFHVREYDAPGLQRVLGAAFRRVQMLGVSGTPAIMDIERARVKQNPLVAYPRMVAQIVLPRSLYERLKGSSGRPVAPVASRRDSERAAFSAADYALDATGLDDCITLVAICED